MNLKMGKLIRMVVMHINKEILRDEKNVESGMQNIE
jgi:hypothetical protein